ncbi:amidase domain-containing protein [Thermoflavimicrobium daqui]|jgi:hypothetical protein|uniref:Putative amidase domain-containing protein n=1 Tax=Thermoflavimicrobium daqui TaxID=2137476 RepID=A0A364K7H6_9BACL|nr:amidase domain-containing protein [Thermoflavimicrobium daqui]RAL26251.1 hypothetical protein DL897_04460 [Thermoflavimicrobium daqui]
MKKGYLWLGAVLGMFILVFSFPFAVYGTWDISNHISSAKKSNPSDEVGQPITYYKERNITLPKDYQVAIKLVKRFAKKQNIPLKVDGNDPKYREVVFMAALNLESYSLRERKIIVDYAKYIDAYENKQKNERIKKLERKSWLGQLTPKEKEELKGLLPVPMSSKIERPSNSSPKGKIQTKAKAQNRYNRIAARDYAYKWWNKRNNEEYGYYSRVSGGCYDCWADCTNFVSQIIKVGGIKQISQGNNVWFYSDKKPSFSWGVANSFFRHFKERAQMVKKEAELEVGDVINVDFDGDQDMEHTAAITKKEGNKVYVTYHSNDTKDRSITDWVLLYNVYGWQMGTAKN